jgi:hypothetical protein
MAIWTVEQRTESWWITDVEADSYEEAIRLSNDSDNWQPTDITEWTDHYIVVSEDGIGFEVNGDEVREMD